MKVEVDPMGYQKPDQRIRSRLVLRKKAFDIRAKRR